MRNHWLVGKAGHSNLSRSTINPSEVAERIVQALAGLIVLRDLEVINIEVLVSINGVDTDDRLLRTLGKVDRKFFPIVGYRFRITFRINQLSLLIVANRLIIVEECESSLRIYGDFLAVFVKGRRSSTCELHFYRELTAIFRHIQLRRNEACIGVVMVILPAIQADVVRIRCIVSTFPAALLQFRNIKFAVWIIAGIFLCPSGQVSFSVSYVGKVFLRHNKFAGLRCLAVVVSNVVVAFSRRHSAPSGRILAAVKVAYSLHFRSNEVKDISLCRRYRLVAAFSGWCVVEISLAGFCACYVEHICRNRFVFEEINGSARFFIDRVHINLIACCSLYSRPVGIKTRALIVGIRKHRRRTYVLLYSKYFDVVDIHGCTYGYNIKYRILTAAIEIHRVFLPLFTDLRKLCAAHHIPRGRHIVRLSCFDHHHRKLFSTLSAGLEAYPSYAAVSAYVKHRRIDVGHFFGSWRKVNDAACRKSISGSPARRVEVFILCVNPRILKLIFNKAVVKIGVLGGARRHLRKIFLHDYLLFAILVRSILNVCLRSAGSTHTERAFLRKIHFDFRQTTLCPCLCFHLVVLGRKRACNC